MGHYPYSNIELDGLKQFFHLTISTKATSYTIQHLTESEITEFIEDLKDEL